MSETELLALLTQTQDELAAAKSHITALETQLVQHSLQFHSDIYYRQMFEMHGLPKLIIDPATGMIVEANPAAANYYGYEQNTLKTMPLVDLVALPPQEVHQRVQLAQDSMLQMTTSQHRLASGETRDVEVYIGPLEVEGKQLFYAIIIDVTAHKQVEAALPPAHDSLEAPIRDRTAELNRFTTHIEAIFNSSSDSILLVEIEQGIQQANHAFDNMFAYSPNAYLGFPLSTLVHPDDVSSLEAAVNKVVKTHLSHNIELRARRSDNTIFDVEIGVAWVNQEGPNHARLVCTFHDITERNHARRAVAEERNLLRTLIDALPDFIYIKDTQHRIIWSNASLAQAWGFQTPDELIGKTDFDFYPAEMATHFHADEDEILRTGQPMINQEEPSLGKNGAPIMVSNTKVPLRNLGGEIIGLIGITRDTTEQKQAQWVIAEERNLLRTLINAVPDFIYIKDTQHRVVLNNAAHTRSLGLQTPDQAIGKTDFEFFSAEMADQFHADEVELFRTGQPLVNRVERSIGQDRSEIWASTTKVPLRNLHGEVVGLVGITHDISGHKRQEEILRQSEERLRVSEQLLQSVLDAIPVRVFWKDCNSVYLGCNRLFAQDVGFEKTEEIIGKRDTDLPWADSDADAYAEIDQTILQSGIAQLDFEETTRLAGGKMMWTLMSRIPLQNPQGDMIGVLGAYIDISARKQAEEALLKSAAEIHDLYNHAPCGYHSLDKDGIFVQINDTELRWLGYSRNEVVGKLHFLDVVTPESRKVFQANFPIFKEQGWISDLEFDLVRKDGSSFSVLVSATAIKDTNNEYVRSRSTLFDITELKRAREALRESEARYRLLAENVSDVISKFTMDGVIHYVTPSCQTQLGYLPEEMLGRLISDFVHPDDAHLSQGAIAMLTRQSTVRTIACRVRRKDGQYIWSETIYHLICDEITGEPIEVMAVSRDITVRKETEKALLAMSQRLELATISGRIGIWEWHPKDDTLIWDDRMLALYGVTPYQFTGKADTFKKRIHPDDLSRVIGNIETSIQNDTPIETDFRIITPNGTVKYIQENGIVIRNAQDEPEYVIGVNWDVTKIKRSEEALRQALEKEKEVGELKSRFVSVASHEFRTPLTTILVTTDTLSAYRHKMDDVQIENRLEKIRQQVHHLKDIINDVLHLAHIQASRVPFKPVQADLDALCQEIVEELGNRDMQPHRLQYFCSFSPVMGRFDVRLIREIVGNLITNALKYSAENTTVEVALHCNGQTAVLHVRDQGIGIPPDDLKHLFEPFHRAANVGTISGTGLGLSIAKQSIELHGGTLQVESEVGKGTTFIVTIPFEEKESRT